MKTIGLIAVAVVVIGVLGYVIAQPSIGWPSEDRRVIHPNGGFSIVQPVGWEKRVQYGTFGRGSDALQFFPSKSVGTTGIFSAGRIVEPVTQESLAKKGYQAITFDGKPAYERWTDLKTTHEHSRSVVFERDGQWCDITVRRPMSETIDAGVWLKYAESFRIEPLLTPKVAATAPLINMSAATTQPGLP
ncbi:MAG: hypothetical protein QM754_13250 [Tepidisphaeraceae bacterium]